MRLTRRHSCVFCVVLSGLAFFGPSPRAADSRSESSPRTAAEAEAWFRRWCRRVEFQDLEASFESIDPSDRKRGTWRMRLAPFFAQRVDFTEFSTDAENTTPGIRRAFGWDAESGEGRTLQVKPDELVGNGQRMTTPPRRLGGCELPADTFFYVDDESSLRSFLERHEVRATPPRPDGRFAVYLFQNRELPARAYVFDPAREFPLVEMRYYTAPSFQPATSRRELLVEADFVRPAELNTYELFVRKLIESHTSIAGFPIPTAWSVQHCYAKPDDVIRVKLEPDSIRLDQGRDASEYQVVWPPGTKVYDQSKLALVWSDGQSLDDSERIRELDLIEILRQAGLDVPGLTHDTGAVPSGCAANALYVAFALLGSPAPLSRLVRDLGISEGNPFSSIDEIVKVADGHAVPAVAVEAESSILKTAASQPVILHAVRRLKLPGGDEELFGHFLVVDDYDEATDTVRVFDPPKKAYRSRIDQVEEAWTGNAVVLGSKGVDLIRSTIRDARVTRYVIAGVAGVVAIALLLVRRSKREGTRA